jgi:hypothetical protein
MLKVVGSGLVERIDRQKGRIWKWYGAKIRKPSITVH